MIAIWLIVLILASLGNFTALQLANWFGANPVLTILMLLFLA